ncbi:MAG: efflux RND transporter periplasmic adaptor subunit, partial [Planctomycetota bacterium]
AEPSSAPAAAGGGPVSEKSRKVTDWTCAMHHQIHMPGPGKCPICGMELIPSQAVKEGPVGPRAIEMSPEAMALAEIQTVPVQRRQVAHEVRMVGKVAIDETRLAYLTAWVPGRLDRLFVDYTGVTVRKGDHMVEIYSPELYSTQKELLVGQATLDQLSREGGMAIVRASSERQVQAAKERLRLWGLTPEQIAEVFARRTPDYHVEIYAPMGGIVIHKNALEGMYVKEGTRIYTIADLTKVWVELDAYEADLSWLRYGEDVEFQTEAYPGDVFHGRIAFIDPVLDDRTRTVRVRLNVENKELRLKPEMFVRATIHASLTQGGKVLDPSLAGKWMGPMHPEIISDKPGQCPECGMDLVLAEDLGFVDAWEPEPSLVIPSTAPLITGKRAVVYVQLPDRKMSTFEGRDVVLGPRAGDWYVVRQGLKEGEQVVVEGNFKIDSELQIRGKPSMMNPAGGGRAPGMAGMAGMGKKKMDAPSGATQPPPSASPAPPAFQKELGAWWPPTWKSRRTWPRMMRTPLARRPGPLRSDSRP